MPPEQFDRIVAASANQNMWLQSTVPLFVGQLRFKSWQCAVIPPTGQNDPTWLTRCADYWDLQMRLYGFRITAMTIDFDTVDGTVIVTTSVRVSEVLPGTRTTERQVWAAHRLKHGPSGVQAS